MAHVKDRDRKNAKLSPIIGQGNLDLSKMMMAGQKAGVKHFFVEVEEHGPLTPTESVRPVDCGNEEAGVLIVEVLSTFAVTL